MNFTVAESQTIHGDTPGNLFVKVRKQLDATNWDEATTFMDSLGRAVKTQAKDSQGDVFVETKYDNLGRVAATSNPYRAGDTVHWSKPRYDELNRVVETYAPEAGNPLDPNIHGASLGVTSFGISTVANYVGTVVTTTDASLRKGRSITNALGQLLRVDEPTATGGTADADLGALDNPIQPTFYTYSPQGKMVHVQQGKTGEPAIQHRYFLYDSLGRHIRVRQPEQDINASLNLSDPVTGNSQWTAAFSYDVLGNVLTATDAKGTVIHNEYDRASRVKTRTYSGEPAGVVTPAVSFFYDGKGLAAPQTPNFAKGKLTRVFSTVSETKNTVFDNFGRLKETQQITDGNTYTSKYAYNFSGALIEEEYPSGRKVINEFESDGDLMRVTSAKNAASVFAPYVSNFSYTASGGISQMRLGNGRWETAKFNNRLQVTELGLGSSSVDAGTWKVNYDYGELQSDGTTVDTAKNTGNIAKQTLTVPGTNFIQAYRYDSLYRLTEAKETTGTSTPLNWSQNWTYDRYGNRLTFTQNIAGNAAVTNPTIDTNTNRFVTTGTNFQYDLNGNLTRDIESRQFTFNGDNKQTVVRDAASNIIGQYFYDGEGKRVKKKVYDPNNPSVVTEETIFVYSSGKLVAEYSTQLSQNPTTSYTTTDHLGSPRVITDQLGQVKSRRDFLPFGEDLSNGVCNRSASSGYGSTDNVRQKFTGYQKDSETNLDFAEARMYENRYGRFTAVDPLLASGDPNNPQSFNRYLYTNNRPLIMIDPTGEFGDYYDRNGNWLRNDGINDHKVYLSTIIGGWRPVRVDIWLRGVTVEQFRTMANVITQEGTSLDSREYLWFAHTANNNANATSNSSMYRMLMSGWSSVESSKKTQLSDKDKSDQAKFARAGVLDVLSGGKDPTGGARFFDGTDFLAWGLKSRDGTPHNKFEEYSEVVIEQGIYSKYLNSQLSKYPSGTVRYKPNHTFKIPAQVFTDPANWKVNKSPWMSTVSSSTFKYTTGIVGRPKLEATGAWGQSIFWKIR